VINPMCEKTGMGERIKKAVSAEMSEENASELAIVLWAETWRVLSALNAKR
jgi:hypothetical protein